MVRSLYLGSRSCGTQLRLGRLDSRSPGAGIPLGVLTGLNVLNYLDRYVLAGVLPLVMAGLHMSYGQAGSLQSVFIIVYSLISPVFGWWGDRGHRLRLAALGVVVWSVATFASGLAPTFAVLLLARALVGVGEASYAVVTPSLIADLYPARTAGGPWPSSTRPCRWEAPSVTCWAEPSERRSAGEPRFTSWAGRACCSSSPCCCCESRPRGRFDPLARAPSGSGWGNRGGRCARRPSYLVNTAAQTIYTFSMGGLAFWMPTYFVQERGLTLARATLLFGACLALAGFLGTLIGGFLGDRLLRRYRAAHFLFSGWTLVASLPFTLLAVLATDPAIFWPAMFVTLLLLFLNIGPLNAAMANVLPAELRARGFAIYTVVIHVLR